MRFFILKLASIATIRRNKNLRKLLSNPEHASKDSDEPILWIYVAPIGRQVPPIVGTCPTNYHAFPCFCGSYAGGVVPTSCSAQPLEEGVLPRHLPKCLVTILDTGFVTMKQPKRA
jgi:hypothetical protein